MIFLGISLFFFSRLCPTLGSEYQLPCVCLGTKSGLAMSGLPIHVVRGARSGIIFARVNRLVWSRSMGIGCVDSLVLREKGHENNCTYYVGLSR